MRCSNLLFSFSIIFCRNVIYFRNNELIMVVEAVLSLRSFYSMTKQLSMCHRRILRLLLLCVWWQYQVIFSCRNKEKRIYSNVSYITTKPMEPFQNIFLCTSSYSPRLSISSLKRWWKTNYSFIKFHYIIEKNISSSLIRIHFSHVWFALLVLFD